MEMNIIFPSWDILDYDEVDVKISFIRLQSYFRPYQISQHRVTLSMFKKLWTTLTVLEKKALESHLFYFYQFLLQKSIYDPSCTSSDLRTTFIDLFNYLARQGYFGKSFEFLGVCSKSLCTELQDILRMVPRSKLRYILYGCLFRRFEKTPMPSTSELRAAILSYASLYEYHGSCFDFIYKKLLRVGTLKGHRAKFENITCGKIFTGNLRKQLKVEVLLAFYLEEEEEYIGMLWKALPFPYVTRKELLDFLEPSTYERNDKLRKLISKKCKLFAKHNLYPFSDVMKPRSLKHLSRVQVLKCLHVDSRVGFKAIPGLNIPATLKGYLMLNEF